MKNITDLRGIAITALDKNGEILYALSIPVGVSDVVVINIVGSDGWLLAPTEMELCLSADTEVDSDSVFCMQYQINGEGDQ